MSDNCCSPQTNRKNIEINNSINNPYSNFVSMNNFEQLEGGWFFMGSEEKYVFPGDGEGPVRKIYVDEFSISKYSVTISEFKKFVDETKYVPDVEKFGCSFVFFKKLEKKNKKDFLQNEPGWKKFKNEN